MKYLENAVAVISKAMVFLAIFCVLGGVGYAKEVKMGSGHVVTWSNLTAVVKGEHLRAIMAAYDDFSKDVNQAKAAKEEKESGADSFPAYSAQVENYDIAVREGSEGYTVIFQLRLSDRFSLIAGDGGTTRYIVDRKTFQIITIDKQK